MNILAVNDDGVNAIGLHKLALALTNAGHSVYVCAPATQQSAAGHAVTIGRLVYVEELAKKNFPEAEMAISMKGTPADCVKFGLEFYEKKGFAISAVLSGFNHGMNLGTDTLYSGTVSAAVEGALCGYPAAALSITINDSISEEPLHFEYAERLAVKTAELLCMRKGKKHKKEGFGLSFIGDTHTIFNINIPDLPESEIKGVKVAPLSYREYEEWFEVEKDSDGKMGYRYSGEPKIIGKAAAGESDVVANRLGYATITPLHFDLTNHKLLKAARTKWEGIEI